MSTKIVCIFCDTELGSDTKPEHIFLNALGGRKTTRRVICSKHNNDFGSGVDNALTKQVEVLRNLLQFKSGTGKPPPALRNLQAGSERVNVGNDGRPELIKAPFTVTDLPDGAAKVEVNAKSPEAIAKMLPHLAARLGMTEEQVIAQISQSGQAALVEMRPDTMHHHIALGGEEALRSVAKSCLVLLATVIGNDAIKGAPFDDARAFVLQGSPEFNTERIQIDSRDVPGLDAFKERFGPFFSLIYVRSDSAGRVIGHFTIYNTISWQIVLAESGGPAGVIAALVSNPLNAATWEDDPSKIPDIPFAWLDAADRIYEIERARERAVEMVKHHVDASLETETKRICDDVFGNHGVTSDDQPITDPVTQKQIVGEIAQRLAAHALGLRHEQTLAPEQIDAMLRGKK